MRKPFYILILLAAFAVSACKKKHIIQPALYTQILTDVILAEANHKLAIRNDAALPHLLDSSYQYIFKRHDVSWELVDTSYKYYNARPHILEKITEDVLDNLHKMEGAPEKK
jgi:hypothetical protein